MPFLTAEWRDLLMLSYEVDPAVLAPYVPAGTEIDTFCGRTFVSLVGFRFLNTRVLGLPIPFHRNFEEINLRFYVRRVEKGEVRRGVVFIREIVPRSLIAFTARQLYEESYLCLPTRHEIGERVSYGFRSRRAWHELSCSPEGECRLPAPGSEEEFIAEHYYGYTKRRDGGTSAYRVAHPQWRVRRGAAPRLEWDVAAVYGEAFVPFLSRTPASAFIAEGSAVTVSRGCRIPV